MTVFDGVAWKESFLSSVLHVPELGAYNLFSVGSAVDKGYTLKFNGDIAELTRSSDNSTVVIAKRSKGEKIYRLKLEVIPVSTKLACIAEIDELRLAHERLEHLNIHCIYDIVKSGSLPNVKINQEDLSSFFCQACAFGKMHKLPSRTSKRRECKVGENIHADIVGPMEQPSLSGSRYALVFEDELSAYRSVFFLKNKSEVTELTTQFIGSVERETNNSVKLFRSDNGTEFVNSKMSL